MTIGERIRQARIEKGLTADELGAAIGKDRATIYRYENNDIGTLKTSSVEPLARALGVTPAYLLGWDNGGEYSEIIGVLNRLNADGVRRVLEYASDLAASGRYEKESTVSAG